MSRTQAAPSYRVVTAEAGCGILLQSGSQNLISLAKLNIPPAADAQEKRESAAETCSPKTLFLKLNNSGGRRKDASSAPPGMPGISTDLHFTYIAPPGIVCEIAIKRGIFKSKTWKMLPLLSVRQLAFSYISCCLLKSADAFSFDGSMVLSSCTSLFLQCRQARDLAPCWKPPCLEHIEGPKPIS